MCLMLEFSYIEIERKTVTAKDIGFDGSDGTVRCWLS